MRTWTFFRRCAFIFLFAFLLTGYVSATQSAGTLEGTASLLDNADGYINSDGDYTNSYGTWVWELNDEHYVTIIGYKPKTDGVIEELDVPGEIAGHQVTKISGNAMHDNNSNRFNNVRTLVLPEGLKTLMTTTKRIGTLKKGSGTFEGFSGLEKVVIPSTLGTPLGDVNSAPRAFAKCVNLREVKMNADSTVVSNNMFLGCTNLTTIDIPSTVTAIGEGAFRECASLKEISLPKHLTKIGDSAFRDCVSLEKIEFHDSLTAIGNYAFRECASLASVQFGSDGESCRQLTSFGDQAFYQCSSLETISIPEADAEKSTFLGKEQFSGCSALKSATLPSTLATGADAFVSCTNLETVTLTNGLQKIPDALFRYAPLKKLNIPNSVISIGDEAFRGSHFTSLSIPDSVTSYGKQIFRDSKIESVRLSLNALSIPADTFRSCEYLKSVTLPYGVAAINADTFRDCVELTSISMPDTVTTIDKEAFYHCIRLVGEITEMEDGTSTGTGILFSKSLATIGESAFFDCEALQSVHLPDSLKTLGAEAFRNNLALSDLILSSSLTAIPDKAFANCPQLRSVDIPLGVTSIANQAFYQDTAIEEVSLPYSITSISENAFSYAGGRMTVKGASQFAEAWAAENNCNYVNNYIAPISIKLANGMNEMILAKRENVAPVFAVEPANATEVIKLSTEDSRVRVVGGVMLMCESVIEEPVSITATAGDVSYTFSITVKDLSGIEVAAVPQKTGYVLRETLDLTGLKINAVFGDGTKEALYDYNALRMNNIFIPSDVKYVLSYSVSGFDSQKAGVQTLTVDAGTGSRKKSTSFSVNVYASADEIPICLQSVTVSDGRATIQLAGAKGDAFLALSTFTTDGFFHSILIKELTSTELNSGQAIVLIDTDNVSSVSAFLLDDTLKPLCRKVSAVVSPDS